MKLKFLIIFIFFSIIISAGATATSDDVAYIFRHMNKTMNVTTPGVWYNLTFDVGECGAGVNILHSYNDSTNDTFTVQKTGVYYMEYVLDFKDSSASPNSNVVYRVVRNGEEIHGSLYEIDLDKKDADRICVGTTTAFLYAGDKIKVQFISDQTTVSLSTDCTFGEHCDTASFFMVMIDKLGGVTMGFEYVGAYIFIMLIGFGAMYLGYKREGVAWYFISTILFATSIVYGMTIPFVTNASGEVIGSSANYLLSGTAFLFAFMSLMFLVKEGIESLNGR